MLVLDTHVWLWLVLGDRKLRKAGYLPLIERFARRSAIYVPAICLWEVSMLASKGRISLNIDTLQWLEHASGAPGLCVYPLTPEVAHESTMLPGTLTGDPCDRMIVATARVAGASLLTFDKGILAYGKRGHVKIAVK